MLVFSIIGTAMFLSYKKIPGLSLLPLGLFYLIMFNYYLIKFFLHNYMFYDAERILEIILLVVTAIQVQNKTAAFFSNFSKLTKYSLILILLMGVISCCLSPVVKMAFLELCLFILLFHFTLFIAAKRQASQTMDKLFLSLIMLGVIEYSLIYLKVEGHFFLHPQAKALPQSVFPGFMNVRFFAQYVAWTFSLVLLPILFCKRIALRTLFYVIACLWWAIGLTTATKSIWISLFTGCVITLCFSPRASFSFIWLMIKTAIGAFILYYVMTHLHACIDYFHTMQAHGGQSAWAVQDSLNKEYTPIRNSSLLRWDMWKTCLNFIAHHPLLGIGPMQFSFYPNQIAAHPHNSVLQIATEWGLPVAILSLVLLFRGLFIWKEWGASIETYDREKNNFIALSIAFLTGMINSLMDGVIVTPLSQVTLCFILGWMLGCYQSFSPIVLSKRTWKKNITYGVVLLLSVVGMMNAIFPQILSLTQTEIAWLIQQPIGTSFLPRFWLQGWI